MSGDSLFDRPVLAIDPGFHTAMIKSADVDVAGRIGVTGSEDRTVRVWSLADGALKRTIRLPQGPGNIGKVYAVAISPDGELIAVGGWTRWSENDRQQQIYIFSAISGMMHQRIDGLPNVANDLAFSPDGERLAATIGTSLRLYKRDAAGRWADFATDNLYEDNCLRVAFNLDGGLATTSRDGRLRLYDADGDLIKSATMLNARPAGLGFNPVDGRLAVGFGDRAAVLVMDGRTLAHLEQPDIASIHNRFNKPLSTVAWSADGRVLFSGGLYQIGNSFPVVAWDDGGLGTRRLLSAGDNTVTSLRPLADGGLLVASADPWLGVLEADDTPRWTEVPRQIDPRHQETSLKVSPDGTLVEFGLRKGGVDRRRFDVQALHLSPSREDGHVHPPRQDGLPIARWKDETSPTLNGAPLPLEPSEFSRCLAIHPDGDSFLLGTEWWLRAFDGTGAILWPPRPVGGSAWAANVCSDGRLVVVAYDDGTIRWHRMEDGSELLSLFPLPDGENWVARTPEGIYAATPGARNILRWHVNRGWDRAAEAIPVSDIPETFRPEVIQQVLPQMGTLGVIGALGLASVRNAVRRVTGSDVPPGARLHVLAIGISDYGEAASQLRLTYADRDARDVTETLRLSQVVLYTEVRTTCLVNEEATKTAIFAALATIRKGMEDGGGDDLAVIHFSGHGDMVDDKFYFLPHGIDDASDAAIKANALPATQFHDEIAAIAKHGRVVVFVDACRSGGVTSPPDRSLRAMLLDSNTLTVFTSCAEKQLSREDMAWENGAFTEALLEALGGADYDHDGLIGVSDLSRYLGERVPALTGGAQRPEVETRGSDIRILARL